MASLSSKELKLGVYEVNAIHHYYSMSLYYVVPLASNVGLQQET